MSKKIQENAWQKVKDKVKGATGFLPSHRKARKSPSGHVIWADEFHKRKRFPWVLAKKLKNGTWQMIPNGKNNMGIPESPYMTERDAEVFEYDEHLGRVWKSLIGRAQIPHFKGFGEHPDSWKKLYGPDAQEWSMDQVSPVYYLKGRQDQRMRLSHERLKQDDDKAENDAREEKAAQEKEYEKKEAARRKALKDKEDSKKYKLLKLRSEKIKQYLKQFPHKTKDQAEVAIDNYYPHLAENYRLSERVRNKFEEMVLEYCQIKNLKTLKEIRKIKKATENILRESKNKKVI